MEGVIQYTLGLPGNERVRSVNALVGETNDGGLNDIRGLHVRPEHVLAAVKAARGGAVEEGSVGAGTGTQAFGWKGGIGTASRRLPERFGGYTLGVLVQSNYGGVLMMDGAPVGKLLGRYAYQPPPRAEAAPRTPAPRTPAPAPRTAHDAPRTDVGDGSCMIVVAT